MNNLKRYTHYILNMIDIVSILVSFEIALFLRAHPLNRWRKFDMNWDYNELILILIVSYILVSVLVLYADDDFLKRNTREEFVSVVKMSFYILIVTAVALYFLKMAEHFSRLLVIVFFVVFSIFDFFVRVAVKKFVIPRFRSGIASEDIILVVPKNQAEEIISKIKNTVDWRYHISGVVISDEDCKGQLIDDIRVVSNVDGMFEDIASEDIDSILIVQGEESTSTIKKWMHEFRKLGKIIHVQVSEYDLYDSYRTLDTIGESAVVTYRVVSPMPRRQQFFHRFFDVLIGLVLLPVFLVVYLIVWLFSLFNEPDHLIISRVRVGRNNRTFYQYRFRVYHKDAKERVEQGKSPYSLIGRILRFTHLDGLPMILNMLIGDMAFIGPKAPNLPKYLAMDSKQRNLLSIKPGLIGYWSCEVEPDVIYKDERNYIQNWSILKDLAIIAYMLVRYFSGNSLRVDGDTHVQEEFDYVEQIKQQSIPYQYEKTYKSHTSIFYLALKRFFDIVCSGLGIIVLSPVFIILMILIIFNDGTNPFFVHHRIGKEGKRISILKFRTMRSDAGDITRLLTKEQLKQYQTEFKVDNDPRITGLGNFLRTSSLDELPQLFNILRGDISFIGPRPVVEAELKNYDNVAKLLSIKPGLTGYWQAYARNQATYKEGQRQEMEMYYIDHLNLWLDIKIFFKTIVTVFTKRGAQ